VLVFSGLCGLDTRSLTAGTTDVLIGTAGIDVFEGNATTYQDTDRIVDASVVDNDSLNLTVTADVNPDVVNVENININLNGLGALDVDASKLSGASVLTVSRGDVVVGGSTLNGNKAVVVDNADSAGVAKIVAGAGTTTVDVNAAAADKAGLIVDASTATGNVSVDGAATILANASVGTVAVDAVTNTTAAETVKATSITANSAAVVTTDAGLTGSVAINAANASTITVSDAQGGATVTGATSSTADSTIAVVDIDSSGATIVTGTGSAVASQKQITIDLDGTAATTDAASVSATGVIALDLDGTGDTVDVVTLSGAEGAVTYNIAANAQTIQSITKAGQNSVTVAGNESLFSGVTITGIDVLDLNAGTAGAIDGSKWTNVGVVVDLGFDNAGNAITVSEASKYVVTSSQSTTGLDFDYAAGAKNLTIEAGDVNGVSNTAVGTLTVTGTLDAAAGATDEGTVAIVANDANLTVTAATTVGAKQTLTVSGDEDVSLGTVTAKAVNASASTGKVSLTATTGVADTVVTGAGDDTLVANGADIHNFAAVAGSDIITITDTQATSQFDAGAGNDTINLNKAGVAYVAVGGEGDDNFTTAVDIEAVIVGGNGTDTLTIGAAAIDFSDNANFAFSSIEKVNLTAATGVTKISAAQLANNATFAITATGDQLDVLLGAQGGALNASGITVAAGSTAVLNYVGSAKADTITGGAANELFTMTKGDDVIDGGTKAGDADQFTAIVTAEVGTGVATVINLSDSAISATEILSQTGLRTEGDVAAAAGTAQTLFNDSIATNDASVTSLAGIEQVVGTAGKDYIVAASSGTKITGGDGDDGIKLGSGQDTVVFEGIVVAANASNITGFSVGASGDIIQLDGVVKGLSDGSAVTLIAVAALKFSGDVADDLIVDTIATLGVLGANIGDLSGNNNNLHQYAIASDTGAIFYDADGNWTAGSVQIGTIGTQTDALDASNFAVA
jgi:hypothetical protein